MFHAVETSVARAVTAKDIAQAQLSGGIEDKSVISRFNKTAADRARLRSFFVPSYEEVGFIENLENLGTETGSTVSISAVSSDDMSGQTNGALGKIQAHLEVVGQWPSVMRALMLSESLPYKSTVSGVKFESSGAASEKDPKILWRVSYDVIATVIAAATSTNK